MVATWLFNHVPVDVISACQVNSLLAADDISECPKHYSYRVHVSFGCDATAFFSPWVGNGIFVRAVANLIKRKRNPQAQMHTFQLFPSA